MSDDIRDPGEPHAPTRKSAAPTPEREAAPVGSPAPVSAEAEAGSPETVAGELHGEIKDYRQPLVTSLGLILGFLLNYLAGWAEKSSDTGMFEDRTDVVIFATIVAAVTLLVYVLYRMLNPRLPEDPLSYYRTSLRLYVTGIVIAFAGFLVAWLV